mgnify:CR=1 FL=1
MSKGTILLTGKLRNWFYDPTKNIVWGNIYDDSRSRFPDGTWVHTSDVTTPLEDIKQGEIIHTMNSHYLLEYPNESSI